jgi:hypothetical protein
MNENIYQVKITGINFRDDPETGVTGHREIELADNMIASMQAAVRFAGWFLNVDPEKVLGLVPGFVRPNLHPNSGNSYLRVTYAGADDTGLESAPATAIRKACPPLAGFDGFVLEITRHELLPADWEAGEPHWNN